MMQAARAHTLSRMANNSRLHQSIDLALGFVGLFLIGLLGWVCDHVATRPRERPVRSAQGQSRAI